MLPPLSKRILEYVGDDLPPPANTKSYLDVLNFAQMAWNYAIFPADSEQSSVVNNMLLQMPTEIRNSIQMKLIEWSERKKQMFPDDNRVIVEIRLKDAKNQITIEAAHYDYGKRKN
jgi:hypothetical protein